MAACGGPPAAARTRAANPAGPARSAVAGIGRLVSLAFAGAADGYGLFVRQSGALCQDEAGRTTDGGARFSNLVRVSSWPCAGNAPAAALAVDGRGDGFLYGPGLFVTHDGGRTWEPGRLPGQVLAVAALGRSVWMVVAVCPRGGGRPGRCGLRLVESSDGGRSWTPAPTQPAGAAVRGSGSGVAAEAAAGQTWLVRTGRSSGYVVSSPRTSPRGLPDQAALWFTRDAGASWSRRSVPCGAGALSVVVSAAPDGTLLAVCAGEPSAGSQAKSAARSTDGGRSWAMHLPCPGKVMGCPPLNFGYLGSIDAVSGRTAFLVGGRSSLLITRDGGVRWRMVRPLIGALVRGAAPHRLILRRISGADRSDRQGPQPRCGTGRAGSAGDGGNVARP